MLLSTARPRLAIAALGLLLAATLTLTANESSAAAVRPAVDQQTIATYLGGSVRLTGSGFGVDQAQRTVTIVSGPDVTELSPVSPLVEAWDEGLIAFTLPEEVEGGLLTVVVDGVASAPAKLRVYAYDTLAVPATQGRSALGLALAQAPDGTLWLNEEFHLELKSVTSGSPEAARTIAIPQAPGPGIFAQSYMGDRPTRISTLGEDVAVDGDGRVWFTQGGGYLYSGQHPNTSRIVRYDPASSSFACFNVPADGAEVIGLLVDELRGLVWYTESGLWQGNAISAITINNTLSDCLFDPRADDARRDPLCDAGPRDDCHYRVSLPRERSAPAHLALDGDGNVWFTEFWRNSVGRLTPETGEIVELPLPASIIASGPGVYVGAGPWRIAAADDGALWVSEYFDATLLRIDPSLLATADCQQLDRSGSNPCVEEIVVASNGSDLRTLHSFAIAANGLVWFAVTPADAGDGAPAQIGFVDTAAGNAVTYLPANDAVRGVTGMTASPDGRDVWFVESGEREVGHLRLLQEPPPAPDDTINCPSGIWLGDACADDLDSDGDGCTDAAELGPDPFTGGQRDPNNYWDFYDVPTMDSGRDGNIALPTDLLGLIRRLGSNDRNGLAPVNRYSDPALPLADETSYHPAFDRSPPPPGAPRYALGPPDGMIDLIDLLGMFWQYGTRC